MDTCPPAVHLRSVAFSAHCIIKDKMMAAIAGYAVCSFVAAVAAARFIRAGQQRRVLDRPESALFAVATQSVSEVSGQIGSSVAAGVQPADEQDASSGKCV